MSQSIEAVMSVGGGNELRIKLIKSYGGGWLPAIRNNHRGFGEPRHVKLLWTPPDLKCASTPLISIAAYIEGPSNLPLGRSLKGPFSYLSRG